MSKYRIVETSTNDDGYLHEQGRVINGKPNKHGCKPLFELKRQKLVPLEDVLALPQAPAWSQEAPKVPGWYWYSALNGIHMVKLFYLNETTPPFAWIKGMDEDGKVSSLPLTRYADGSWAGPIVPPEGTR